MYIILHFDCNDSNLSANTTLVFVTFSIVNFVFPPVPAILPIALDKWSPFNGFTVKNGQLIYREEWIINIL